MSIRFVRAGVGWPINSSEPPDYFLAKVGISPTDEPECGPIVYLIGLRHLANVMIRPEIDCGGFSGASDESLMQAITDRKQPALRELYDRYGGRLKLMIGTVVHEEGDADDVLQDIMIQIWREARRYSPKQGKPLGWVVTLARRRAIDRVRRRQAYCRAKDRYSEQLEYTLDGHSSKRSADEISRRDLRSFLDRQLQRLPGFQRQAVKLAFYKGMSHREIAAATNSPLGTVKTRLELGLQKLTHAIKPLRYKI